MEDAPDTPEQSRRRTEPDPVEGAAGPEMSLPRLPDPEPTLVPDVDAAANTPTPSVDERDLPVDNDATGETDRGSRQVARFRWRQRIVRALGVLILLGLAYYGVSLFQVWSTGRADERDPVDAIVVLGAAQFDGRPSPQLAARLDHVLVLWPEDVAPLVVTTGGNMPGDRFTEAESSANYLIDRGVPADVILQEDDGATTYESLEAVAALLAERGLDEIVIVTDPYHAKRSQLIAESVGLQANVSSTTTSVVAGATSLRRHLVEAGGVALGRIVGFERLDSWTN